MASVQLSVEVLNLTNILQEGFSKYPLSNSLVQFSLQNVLDTIKPQKSPLANKSNKQLLKNIAK
jgi:hypothetical protein